MDHQSKTYNLVNAASSLKNYEFDFGDLSGNGGAAAGSKGGASLSGIGGGSLKQQKMGASVLLSQTGSGSGGLGSTKAPDLAAPIAPNFRPMAKPWEVAAEKMKGHTTEAVPVAASHTVQAAFKEKANTGVGPTAPPAGGSAAGAGSTPSWMANYLSSSQAGTAIGKPDPLAGLWNSAATTAPLSGTRSTGGAAAQVPSGGGASADPFDFFSGGKPTLAAMKASKSSSSGGGMGASPVLGSTSTTGAQSAGVEADPFNLASVKAAVPLPSQPKPSAASSAAAAAADPFAQFGQHGLGSGTSGASSSRAGDPFGAFGASAGPAAAAPASSPSPDSDPFGSFSAAPAASAPSGFGDFSDSFGSGAASAGANGSLAPAASSNGFDAFFGAAPAASTAASAPAQPSRGGSDPLADMFFGAAPAAAAAAPAAANGAVGADDWGTVFGESAVTVETDAGGTVELEGLPPPPAGLTASTASEKGEAFFKAGQFADAIKWLLWAEALVGAPGGDPGKVQLLCRVLTTRAGCYKEAGEMKKAVADCTQVLELDSTNSTVLLQRAILYEGMEKYKKGVDDLREVLKLDPGNRPAMSMLNRLQKMV